MADTVKHIPEGFHSVTPFLIVKNAARAIEFYTKAFGAKVLMRLTDPSGNVMHAEIKIGDAPLMIGVHQEIDERSSQSLPLVSMYLYVEDVDAVVQQAIATGAKELRPVKDQSYGDREGGVKDPFGIVWWIATHKEDVSHEEMQKTL